MPLVSVVIPTKGRPELLTRAVNSVLAQTMADLEIIVVVDGDDPATVEQLGLVTDSRLRFLVNAVSRGSGAARNQGGADAKGQWIGFLDDDDEWLPTKLERQLALGEGATDRIILTCRSTYETPHGVSVRPRTPYANTMPFDEWLFDRRQLFGGESFIQTSSLLMPTALFREYGFPDHGQHEDWEMVIIALKYRKIALVTAPEILVRHYAEAARPSLTQGSRIAGSLRWLDRLQTSLSPKAYSGFCLTVVAQQAARHGQWRDFFRLLRRAFRNGQPTIVQFMVFLMVWFVPEWLHNALRRLRPRGTHPRPINPPQIFGRVRP